MILGGLDSVATWDAVIDAEPALAVVALRRAVRRRAAGDRELRRSQVAVHPRPLARRRRARGRGRRAARARPASEVRTLRRAGLVHDFGRLGVSNAIWDKRGPLGAGEWERVRMHPYLTERMLASVRGARAAGRDRGAAPRAPRRLGLPARALPARRSRCRRASSAPPTPTRRCASRGRTARRARADEAAAELRAEVQRPAASTATPSRRCSAPPATACCAAAKGRPG